MTLRDAAAMALRSLSSSAARTVLTILGLAVGVAAVLTVQAMGEAGEARVEEEIARMGVNKAWVTSEEGGVGADAVRLARLHAESALCAGACTGGIVSLGGMEEAAQIAGYDEGMQAVHGGSIVEGRTFIARDYAEGAPVCLVNGALAEALGGDVLGRRLSLGGRRLMIVGVVEGLSLPMMALGGQMAALPLSTWEDTFGAGGTAMTLTVPAGMSASAVLEPVMAALGTGYRADTLDKEIGAARQIVRIFVMVLSCVALVCMLTGAIGVMNVLLVSVRERRREIGLIKALGATSGKVAALFLMEAMMYTLLGGLLGLGLGAGLTAAFGAWMGLQARLRVGQMLPVLLAAAGMGLAFGVAPALRAAHMPVVDALRTE